MLKDNTTAFTTHECDTQDQALAITTSTLLDSAVWLLPFHVLFAAVSIYSASGNWVAVIPFLLTLWIAYLHLRIAFDKGIFKYFSKGLPAKAFDDALVALKLLKKAPERSMAERCAGAIRLLKQLALGTFLQAIFLCFSLL